MQLCNKFSCRLTNARVAVYELPLKAATLVKPPLQACRIGVYASYKAVRIVERNLLGTTCMGVFVEIIPIEYKVAILEYIA